MVTPLEAVGLAVILLVNTAVAALATRFFRVRLQTSWGSVVYTALLVPLLLLVSTLVFGGVVQLGPDLGSPTAVVALTIAGPLAVGIAFDYFWMPAPEDVSLPETGDGRSVRRD